MAIGDAHLKRFDDARREYRGFRETKARQCGPSGSYRTSRAIYHATIWLYAKGFFDGKKMC